MWLISAGGFSMIVFVWLGGRSGGKVVMVGCEENLDERLGGFGDLSGLVGSANGSTYRW